MVIINRDIVTAGYRIGLPTVTPFAGLLTNFVPD